jgi:signal transduction histidine kinase
MKASKNTITLILIISSVLLLVVLQVVWLNSAYEKSYFSLRRKTSDILRNSVFTLRDSILLRNIEQVPGDSFSVPRGAIFFSTPIDTLKERVHNIESTDSGNISSQIKIYINSNHKTDSIQRIIRPLASRVQQGNLSGSSFILRLSSDSLSIDSIRFHFKDDLEKESIELPFEIKYVASAPPPIDFKMRRNFFRPPGDKAQFEIKGSLYSNTLNTEWIRFDPIHEYSAEISGIRTYILKEITPQVAFSIFLTLLTSVSFAVMYISMKSQQRLMVLKNDFISNITHELKTPITTVGVAIEALKNFKGIDNPKLTSEYLDIAQNELNRLSLLTDKILKTAVFENKGIDYIPEQIEFDNLVEKVISSMKPVMDKQNAKVTYEKEGDSFTIPGSEVHLTGVIYNLLDNALKYSPNNPEINITVKEKSESIVLSVNDHGIGIPVEFKKKVFEKFFRVPTGDVHNIKGYGLGLSYVKSVIKSHKGKIIVESEPEKGSNFIVTLPK